MKKIIVTYLGQTWPSLSALGARLGLDVKIISRAIRVHGADLDAAGWTYTPGETFAKRAQCIRYGGRDWSSQRELARSIGVTQPGICAAVKRHGADLDAAGWTPRADSRRTK